VWRRLRNEELHDLHSRYFFLQGRKRTGEWRKLHNVGLHDQHYRYCCVRKGANSGVEGLHDEELHDLHPRYCGVREGAIRGVEKSARRGASCSALLIKFT